ncbi:unnamed protein product [Eruca vesicaria subsp. sativa]|uniref:Cysteine/Histidine-rich C1 domain family protein n=1 Tax=Eruca vesicaria subsp. sativa TaxID=29727 RepID=A0ABC8K2C2_ERUVS|nr:unnamed protein product [Eruca vesicaria subsp. sativa]
MNSVCGVCRKKVDWTCGGFSCQRCPGYVVHSRCATREDVWNGEELEEVPEEEEDIEPYVVIDDNTIQHFSQKEHYLRRIHGNGVLYEENKWCSACTHPIGLQSFYGCMDCDFSLHQSCAECPKRRRHVLHNDRLTLVTSKEPKGFICHACFRRYNGFMYKHGHRMLDVQCGSISEPFFHPSHPQHPLYYIPTIKDGVCNGCNVQDYRVLRCIEVCRKKVDWTCCGFSCQRCPGYVVHSRCATREDVWNGEELEEVPEEEEDIEPYVVIDDNTIQHFSHKEHYLRRIHGNGVMYEENKWCSACTHPIGLQSFYGCMDCDFSLHQSCAECPKRRRHVLHNDQLVLVTNKEPKASFVMLAFEGDCGFVLGFYCTTLPQVVKHIVDNHPLSLYYGEEEEEASGKYWCDICEKETNPKNWFYTCKDQQASLHTNCVLGRDLQLMPRSIAKFKDESFEVVLNNSVTRPICSKCKSRCMYPINFKLLGTSATYFCSTSCTIYYAWKV